MKNYRLLVIMLAFMLAACTVVGTTQASKPAAQIGALQIIEPWIGATETSSAHGEGSDHAEHASTDDPTPTTTTGAGYMRIINTGSQADTLLSVSTDVAQAAELHTGIDENGMMVMRPIEGGVEIPPGGTFEMKPGGYHIMMVDLHQVLTQGNTVNITLRFQQTGEITVAVPVRER